MNQFLRDTIIQKNGSTIGLQFRFTQNAPTIQVDINQLQFTLPVAIRGLLHLVALK